MFCPAAAASALWRRDFRGDVGGRFAPGQIDVDMLGGDAVPASDEPPK